MGASPLEIVKDKFGGRAKLVEELAAMVDKQHGDSTTEAAKSRLMGLSNAKLLRLYRVEQVVRERYGDRAKLVAQVIDARKRAGYTVDDAYRAKLDGFSKARLLDLARAKLPEAEKKKPKAEKLAARRGKKQRARVAAKSKG
jgi:hypothetical protein